MPDPAALAAPGPADSGPADTGPADTGPADTGLDKTVPASTALTNTGPANPGLARIVLATVVDTPIGPLSLLARDGRLIAGGFIADPGGMHARLDRKLRTLPLETAGPDDLSWLIKPIASYFGGDLHALDAIPVHQPGTPSRQRLWAALRAVPPGRTVTYTQLAVQAGCPHAPRAAGAACALNLIAPVVPCHRALRMDGSLGGYYYGLDRKTWLLRHEGVQGR